MLKAILVSLVCISFASVATAEPGGKPHGGKNARMRCMPETIEYFYAVPKTAQDLPKVMENLTASTQPMLAGAKGKLHHRVVTKTAEGSAFVVNFWTSQADAEAFNASMFADPNQAEDISKFMAMLDGEKSFKLQYAQVQCPPKTVKKAKK
jgi:heme-degrading monooxygenase HmoA